MEKTHHRILIGNNLDWLPTLEEGSVHLGVTSPPYYNERDYAQWESYEEYLADMRRTLEACYRVLAPGRRLVWNVAVIPQGAKGLLAIPHDTVQIAREVGWVFRDEAIWVKDNIETLAPPGTYPYPGNCLIMPTHEHLLHFRKPGQALYGHVTPEQREAGKIDDDQFYSWRLARSCWTGIKPEGKRASTWGGHSAPFPFRLVEPVIRAWSFPGETVLDPFCGSGTVSRVAADWGRNSVGIELHPEFIPFIRDRLGLGQERLFDEMGVEFEEWPGGVGRAD